MSWDEPGTRQYTVRTGDTLYGIAWRYGLDHRDLARWNDLGSGNFIKPGQKIDLSGPVVAAAGPAGKTAAPAPSSSGGGRSTRPATTASSGRTKPISTAEIAPPRWSWPVRGRIVSEFGSESGPRTGALLEGVLRAPVHSAADGRVVYAGSGLIGYGKLIIVKHNDAFLSAYGHNDKLLVAEGDQIQRGEAIARMGQGPGQKPRLHFEIRRNGKPVNPRRYLPAR